MNRFKRVALEFSTVAESGCDVIQPSALLAASLITLAAAAGWIVWKSEFIARSVATNGIAVLPFENLSPDPDNAYFAVGIQDEILTRLASIADLKVI